MTLAMQMELSLKIDKFKQQVCNLALERLGHIRQGWDKRITADDYSAGQFRDLVSRTVATCPGLMPALQRCINVEEFSTTLERQQEKIITDITCTMLASDGTVVFKGEEKPDLVKDSYSAWESLFRRKGCINPVDIWNAALEWAQGVVDTLSAKVNELNEMAQRVRLESAVKDDQITHLINAQTTLEAKVLELVESFRWIPVGERLPEELKRVECKSPRNVVYLAHYVLPEKAWVDESGKELRVLNNPNVYEKITHWRDIVGGY